MIASPALAEDTLSHADTATIRRLSNRKLESHTEKTITDGRQLRDDLKQIAAKGYAVDDEEITRGLICIAAPVFGVDGEIAGAMSCTFPSYVFDENGMEAEIRSVVKHAKAVSGSATASS